jgi:hypothetical protein
MMMISSNIDDNSSDFLSFFFLSLSLFFCNFLFILKTTSKSQKKYASLSKSFDRAHVFVHLFSPVSLSSRHISVVLVVLVDEEKNRFSDDNERR